MSHSLLDFARDIAKVTATFAVYRHEVLEEACKIVEEEAKRVIGTYDYKWEELHPATKEDRLRKGYKENEPLLREGDLRDSISHYVGFEDGYVGSPSKIALYQELGTSSGTWGGNGIPPRSFLGGAARAKEHEIHELGAKAGHKAITRAMMLR